MEVHHHPHVEKKRFKEYLLEFIMIFLAVTLGFFAENFREKQVEKQKGNEYIYSFYKDLVKDTAEFTNVISSYEEKSEVFKSRNECYNEIISGKGSGNCIVALFRYSEFFVDMVYTDGTLQQLKNAGGLRLLKKNDADSILSYDDMIRAYSRIESTGFQDRQNKIRDLIYSITNYAIIADSNYHGSPVFDLKNKEAINNYFVLLNAYAIAIERDNQTLKNIKAKAVDLIEYFKKQYHLK